MHDSYGKKKPSRSTPSKYEESGDYNHGLNKATSNVMMNLKPLSSNIQSHESKPPREKAIKPVRYTLLFVVFVFIVIFGISCFVCVWLDVRKSTEYITIFHQCPNAKL